MNLLGKFRPLIEDELRKLVVKGRPPLLDLETMLTYHLGFTDQHGKKEDAATGKYMRSLFCMAICAGLGGNPQRVLPAAACLELAHRTTLIFDDIQDKGEERNNRPTVWTIWGVNQAINAGFALSSYSHLALLGLRRQGVPNTVILEVWKVLENTVLGLCQGQHSDISFMDRCDITLDDYLEMVRGKTALLFASSCEIGAMLAAVSHRYKGSPVAPHDEEWFRYIGDRPVASLAAGFGMNMGIAFQIHDDYLGVWGNEAMVGKTANDIIEKKRALPMVLALQEYPEPVKAFLERKNISDLEANLMRDSMERNGIMERVKELEMQYTNAAWDDLEALQLEDQWNEEISGLLRLVTDRVK